MRSDPPASPEAEASWDRIGNQCEPERAEEGIPMNNSQIAEIFDRIADFLEIKGEKIFKVLAYRRAAEAIRTLGQDIAQIREAGELESIPGVGKAIAGKVEELLESGELEYYERLKREIPIGTLDLLKVDDVGPKKASRFWKELGIDSLDKLESAAREGRLRELAGMGAKSEARILASIESLKRRDTDRLSLGMAMPLAEELLAELRRLPGVKAAEAAGSLRRGRDTVGDIDLLVAASDPEEVLLAFAALPRVGRVRGSGGTKASVELIDGMRVQLWVHAPERFGSALQYATGSQQHNVKLRELSLQHGLSLSEHGFKRDDGSEITCATEAEVYEQLGMPWIAPELREGYGEIQAALGGELPALVELKDLKGELHAHTDWSDGKLSIEAMGRAALERDLAYLVISDHSRSLGVANGLSVKRLREQREAIEGAQQALGSDITLLQGAEVEILANGALDYPDDVLAELDIVIASVHTSLRQPREKITQRMLGAIGNPHVDVIAHPTGRLIGRREPGDFDMDRILQAAASHDVILEINANPERLDLNDVYARRAIELGCRLAINTDAHRAEHLDFRIYGVAIARRAWASAEQIVNCWPLPRLFQWLAERTS